MAAFVSAADSVYRAGGDAALSQLVKDNPDLVGASVAKLLEGDAALARRVAALSGSVTAKELVEVSARWTKTQRAQRANAVALESQSVEVRKAGDIDKSIKLLGDARAIYEKIGDKHSVAVNLGTVGLTRFATGKWDEVIADYDKALVARRSVEDRILEGRTLNGLGTAFQQKGVWDKAADYYAQAIALREKTGDLTGLGTSITYLGHVYNRSGRYVEARKQYEAALPIVQSLNNASQSIDLLSGIAVVNASMGRLDDS
ncbi:MAG TPA: tetratricopeptide repeat protein, partial [Candidatus Krumholzibacteria bacterium]|nr:tetratricopeptide repeat protein [Candidatus Krumholzibacteria bacterium]